MRVRGSKDHWADMEQFTDFHPYLLELQQRSDLPAPFTGEHHWRAKRPAELTAGSHVIEIEATDMFGFADRDYHVVQVVG